ncbi:uncharacterized protein LOC119771121 [Culex quinquefasciatus]|uniref:uncharacterized protein LOC119771121 n=1 Tax=Culex quinquefasciatus TaxID=7176 RepID=UPI0018E2DE30|nr:uncharacterized protein LOC119771121 [Culex quinquefasciatus]
MNTRALEYCLACSAVSYDVIAVTETWLKASTLSTQVFGNGYEVFRGDREQFVNSQKRDGGGVAIAVRHGLRARIVVSDEWKCAEQVWVAIDLDDHTVFICAAYIPPDQTSSANVFEINAASVLAVSAMARPYDELIVLGDFNLPGLIWRPSGDGFLYADSALSTQAAHVTEFLDSYSSSLLQQINSFPNENNVVLDLCFVSCPDTAPPLVIAPAPLVKDVRHHPPLLLSLPVRLATEHTPVVCEVRYDYRNLDVPSMLELLQSIDWENTLDKDNLDEAVQTFTNILSYAIDRHVPKKPVTNARVPWQTSELRRVKAAKRSALKNSPNIGRYLCTTITCDSTAATKG